MGEGKGVRAKGKRWPGGEHGWTKEGAGFEIGKGGWLGYNLQEDESGLGRWEEGGGRLG